MTFDPNKITLFAKTDARGQNMPFGIKALDRSRHMYVIGKTGMGKSTLLENMAVQDIKNGEGLAFIDPHGQTAETLLDYIPEERKDDVLYFAPFDTNHPVAFNVMEDVGPDKRHLVVSGLMSVFKKIWIDAWSARMEYILQNTLLALLEYPDSTLLGVNRMLSEKNYRKKVIDNISDPAVKSFWVDEFLNYNERYMQEAGDAIKNKIGQFTANPLIRNIIGQPKSSFDIRKMMDEKKIIIMNLSKGLVGESNANLLGSMLTTRIYLAAMSRADLSQAEMKEAPQFYFYVDEFQSFANATFADILSEARKYKLNLTIAHQYIEQMEEEVRNAVFGNVGTIVSFRVGPFDAEVLETIFAPQFYAVDICNLGFAQIYLTLMIDGIGSAPFSAVTLPPIEHHGVSCKDMVIHSSRTQFATPRAAVEQAIVEWAGGGMLPEANKSAGGNKGGGNNNANNKSRPAGAGGAPGNRKPNNSTGENSPRSAKSFEATNKPPMRSPKNESAPSNTTDNTKPVPDRRPPDNRNQKTAEDLRAVLASLVKADSSSEKAKAPEVKKPEATAAKSDETKQPAPPAKESEPKKDEGNSLKEALAKMVKESEGKKAPPEKLPEQPASAANARADNTATKPAPAAKSEPVTENRPPATAKENIKNTHESNTAETAKKAEAPSPASNNDPFDPKVLERMMRVKTGDKTPFK